MGLDDALRLSAFRECLKGKTGEQWWAHSRIDAFDTLKTRFYNQFICQTPQQRIELLKKTTRSRGMSAEVWGDLISRLCDDARCYDSDMRYQYFLSGLRNREWKATLSNAMVDSIPQAVTVLLYKNMHLPVENDADFEDSPQSKSSENAMMQQTQNLLAQQQQQQQYAQIGVPQNATPTIAVAHYEDPAFENASTTVATVASETPTRGHVYMEWDVSDPVDKIIPTIEWLTALRSYFSLDYLLRKRPEPRQEGTLRIGREEIEAYQDGTRTVSALGGVSERAEMVVNEKEIEREEYGTECSAENDEREESRVFEETSVPTREFMYDRRGENTRKEETMMAEALLPLESRVAEATAEEEDYFCDYYAEYKEMASLEDGQPVEVTASERVASSVRMDDNEQYEEETLLDEERRAGREKRSEEENEESGNGETEEPCPSLVGRGSLKPEVIRALEKRFESGVSAVRVLFQWPPYKPSRKREVVHVQFMNSGEVGTENASKDEEPRAENPGEQERSTPSQPEGDIGEEKKGETFPSKNAGGLAEVNLLEEKNAVGGTAESVPESEDSTSGRSVTPAAIGPEPLPEETSVAKGRPRAKFFTTEELDALEGGAESPIGEEREEYDKELEERLFPLDEVELKKRVKATAEQKKELSITELSCILGIPEETLEKTRESSPGELSTPEYWIKCSSEDQTGGVYEHAHAVSGVRARNPERSGLSEIPGSDALRGNEDDAVVPEGKRIIGSVGGVEAVSTGYIDCLPTAMLIDSGAVASLIDHRVLRRLGMTDAPLEPYHQELKGVSGQALRVRGVVRLPMRLESKELIRPFVVIEKLHVDVILGTDTLRAYRAVVDLDDSTGEAADDSTVLVEGYVDLDETVKMVRTLCTVKEGKVVVEVCNASEEDVIIKKGTLIAAATVVPATAFAYETESENDILDVLGNAKLFSTMDIASGYWNVPMAKGSVEKTAFTCKYGLFEWLVMPFDLCNAVPAFERLMENVLVDLKWLVEPPILVYPDFSKRFKLYVDSSTLAIGACLMQTVEGRERVVAYASKLFVGSEKNWDNKTNGTSEIESLTWVFDEKNSTSNSKLARWAMELSQLRFKVFHKPGTAMGHVDGLSRLHADTINAVTMTDLLNDVGSEGDGSEVKGELLPTIRQIWERFLMLERFLLMERFQLGARKRGRVLPPGDMERFIKEQKRTPWIMAMIAYLKDGALALDPQLRTRTLLMTPNYEVKTGVLMRKVFLKARAGPASSIEVPVIPLPFISTILNHCHTDVLAAHVGVTKTLNKVRKHAFWHGWKRDVAEYVRECTACGSGKGYRPWKNGLMQRMPIQEPSGPFSLLVVGAIGPLVTTPRGNIFILVFADYFTRWVEAFAIGALDTVAFVETMVNEVISRHGVPERLLSDQGSNFISELARSFYETLGIKKLFGAAYHPQTQGLVERFNGTLIGMLKMFVNEAQTDWDLYLPRVLFAYRTSYHESLKDSPFFSLYGRDPVLPLDLAFLNTDNTWKSNEAQDRYILRPGRVETKFEAGDPVWVYHAMGENTYRVAIPSHPNRVVSINVNLLKHFQGRWSRPFPTEVPDGIVSQPGVDDEGPLEGGDLPSTSYVERLVIGGEETALSGAATPIVDILARRKEKGVTQYLVLLATYEVAWRCDGTLLPNHGVLIKAFEDARHREKGLSELRRSARLAEVNIAVDEDSMLF
ncbi:Retrovirus-related Pol Polyprotein [Phytophthora palmivora]|uniref:Retrovirus-related Pol Polyprotein n=1 Tax=Phytophthora palmivora TaxID=4796 RepID=A0A2P4Y8B3_9STRA|nr:Retrovirus-related Pol Polyprotein [Phytophthora palmivora]